MAGGTPMIAPSANVATARRTIGKRQNVSHDSVLKSISMESSCAGSASRTNPMGLVCVVRLRTSSGGSPRSVKSLRVPSSAGRPGTEELEGAPSARSRARCRPIDRHVDGDLTFSGRVPPFGARQIGHRVRRRHADRHDHVLRADTAKDLAWHRRRRRSHGAQVWSEEARRTSRAALAHRGARSARRIGFGDEALARRAELTRHGGHVRIAPFAIFGDRPVGDGRDVADSRAPRRRRAVGVICSCMSATCSMPCGSAAPSSGVSAWRPAIIS
jgi:hypothetical protein